MRRKESWIEGEAVRQLYATAKLDCVQRAVGFPDLHPSKGSPIGAAFVTENVIYPHLIGGDIGGDIGCGIGCGMALFQTDLVRRDAKLDRWAEKFFHLEHAWDGDVGKFLAEQSLESTEFDSSLGTIGGGNHFAEVQAVEEILDADAFRRTGLGKQQLVVLVHSGSRGLGESILRAQVDQHADNSITHYEYDGETVWLHRKGAVDAESDFVVISGSRGSFSYLVKPTGDGASHAWSLAHGAGRK